jgi:S1-C subfamily serine protease
MGMRRFIKTYMMAGGLSLTVFSILSLPSVALEDDSIIYSLEKSFIQAAKLIKPAVVHIEIGGGGRSFFNGGVGSGVIVSSDGYILTNNHVVSRAAGSIKVSLADGREFDAEVVGLDPSTDLAVIKIRLPDPLQAAPLGDSDGVKVGQWAMAVGSSFGFRQTVTLGVVSGTGRNIPNFSTLVLDGLIQTDAAVNPGNSGGPLVDLQGRVIGINTMIFSSTGRSSSGVGLAIPINTAREVASILIRDGRITRGFLGVTVRNLEPEAALGLGLPDGGGVLVSQVMRGQPAAQAGIKSGDVIKRIDGKEVKSVSDMVKVSTHLTAGRKIEVVIIRDRQERTLTVTLAKMPSSLQDR